MQLSFPKTNVHIHSMYSKVAISNLEEIQNQTLACKFKPDSRIGQGQQIQKASKTPWAFSGVWNGYRISVSSQTHTTRTHFKKKKINFTVNDNKHLHLLPIFIHQIVGFRTTQTAQDGIHSFRLLCLQFKKFLEHFFKFSLFQVVITSKYTGQCVPINVK